MHLKSGEMLKLRNPVVKTVVIVFPWMFATNSEGQFCTASVVSVQDWKF
jgi:hypothetical protein